MELHIDSIIATVPSVGVFGIDTEGHFGRMQIEELLYVRKVVAKGRLGTLDTNIVGVQTSGLVGRRQRRVAQNKGRLAGKVINGTIALVALMDQRGTTRDSFLHGIVDGIVENLDSMRVVCAHFRVPFVLFLGISFRERSEEERNKVRPRTHTKMPHKDNLNHVLSPLPTPSPERFNLMVLGRSFLLPIQVR